MYRGRGGRGGGRPYPSLRGVRPVQMKPGRGRSGGPRPLSEPGWAPLSPPHGMMRGMGPRPPPPFGPPMRGRGGPPSRGRGAGGVASRGWSSTRSRGGARGRGAPRGRGATRGRGAAKTTTPTKKTNTEKKAMSINEKTERDRDAMALTRPWLNDTLRAEIEKKSELLDVLLKSNDEKDKQAFRTQRSKVGNMLRIAKMEFIGMQDEQDVDKIMAAALKKNKDTSEKPANGDGAAAETGGAAAETGDAAAAAETETTANGEATAAV